MADIELIDVPDIQWPYKALDLTNTPPASPASGDTYVVGSVPTGAWVGHANTIAWRTSTSTWKFQVPAPGRRIYVVSLTSWRGYTGTGWVVDPPSLPAGGTAGQILTKQSGAEGDAAWTDNAIGVRGTRVFITTNWENVGTQGAAAVGDVTMVFGPRYSGDPVGGFALYENTGPASWPLRGSIADGGGGGAITSITAGTGLTGGGSTGVVGLGINYGLGFPSALAVGGTTSAGTDSSPARANHTHALPAFGSAVGTLCQGSDSRLSNDRTASGIRTSTGIVAVSTATAPTVGQSLVATSATTAAWQTLTGATQPVQVNNTPIASRDAINLIAGSNVTITGADDSANNRVNVTIAASGAGGGGAELLDYYVSSIRSQLTSNTGNQAMTAGMAYFVYLGQVKSAFTPTYVNFYVANPSGTTIDVGYFSSPAAPARSGQTLTCLMAGASTGVASAGVKRNASAFTTSVSTGVHLWYGLKAPNGLIVGPWLLHDMGQGLVLTQASAAAFSPSTTYTGSLVGVGDGLTIAPACYLSVV